MLLLGCRQIQVVRTQHQKDQHPYQPFPIALLEETVDKVPASAYSEQEKCLLDFGVSQLYRWEHWAVYEKSTLPVTILGSAFIADECLDAKNISLSPTQLSAKSKNSSCFPWTRRISSELPGKQVTKGRAGFSCSSLLGSSN